MNELQRVARALAKSRARLTETMAEAEAAAISAHADGVSEVEIARTLGVNRMTVRRWLGKL
jgi:DNA invertase Pin-like site-specific DNA recombinase